MYLNSPSSDHSEDSFGTNPPDPFQAILKGSKPKIIGRKPLSDKAIIGWNLGTGSVVAHYFLAGYLASLGTNQALPASPVMPPQELGREAAAELFTVEKLKPMKG